MPRYTSVFVDTSESKESVAKAIGEVLNVKLESIDDEHIFYGFTDEQHILFELGTHELINDVSLGINFEDYPYQIEVRGFGFPSHQTCYDSARDYARQVFHKLKSTQKYRLMLVEDVDTKLDEFDPNQPGRR